MAAGGALVKITLDTVRTVMDTSDMATIRFGKACDRCPTSYNNYSCGDIVTCDDCGLDLCKPCRDATGHVMVREVCCQECPDEAAGCDPETIAESR